jgi:hypothetical protein
MELTGTVSTPLSLSKTAATFSVPVTSTVFTGPLTGNASTATTLQNARTIALSGDVGGSVSFNGSANVTIAATVVSASETVSGKIELATDTEVQAGTDTVRAVTPATLSNRYVKKSGDTMTGGLTSTLFTGPLTGVASGNVKQGGGTGQLSNVVYIGWSAGSQLRLQVDSTDFGSTWPISTSGNSASATILQNARTLALSGDVGGSVSFNGSANATIAATIQNNSVTTAKIANNQVTAPKLSGAQTGAAPIYGARAWVNFDADRDSSGATNTSNTNRFIRSSGNVSSVLKTATGKFTVTMTTELPNTNYAVIGTAGDDGAPRFLGSASSTQTTTQFFLTTDGQDGDVANLKNNSLVVFG